MMDVRQLRTLLRIQVSLNILLLCGIGTMFLMGTSAFQNDTKDKNTNQKISAIFKKLGFLIANDDKVILNFNRNSKHAKEVQLVIGTAKLRLFRNGRLVVENCDPDPDHRFQTQVVKRGDKNVQPSCD